MFTIITNTVRENGFLAFLSNYLSFFSIFLLQYSKSNCIIDSTNEQMEEFDEEI